MNTAMRAKYILADHSPDQRRLLADAIAGLSASPKRLSSKYFYDARGSALFEAITQQPEYYLTRTELQLLERVIDEIAVAAGPAVHVVEPGSGSGRKTALLLHGLQHPVAYTPIEISRAALLPSIQRLATELPEVEMLPVCADFTRPVMIPNPRRPAARRLVFFPGSTLGNFEHHEAVDLLSAIGRTMGGNGMALVGIDLHKQAATIEAAYNDAAGVTADFTLNLLHRLNDELGADFDLARFAHRARYCERHQRIETSLVSLVNQEVHIEGHRFAFVAGEAMQVEYSHKYTDDSFSELVAAAGLRVHAHWDWADPAYGLRLLRHA